MHEPQLSIAAMPQPPRLFRVQLRHYSLGHELHLYRRVSPFLDKEHAEFFAMPRGVKLAATMQAIEVCARDYAGNLRPPKNWMIWRRYCEWCNLDNTVNLLWRHLQEAHDAFESELPSGEGMKTRLIGAPHVLRLYQFICDRIPQHELAFYSDARRPTAWDFPYSLATMLAQSDAETKGELSVFNVKDKALKEHAARAEKEDADSERLYNEYVEEERKRREAECPTP